MMGAFADAWADELAGEPFADLPDAEAAGRALAFQELRANPVAAIWSIEYTDGVDEIHAVLSWVDDVTIWPPPVVATPLPAPVVQDPATCDHDWDLIDEDGELSYYECASCGAEDEW